MLTLSDYTAEEQAKLAYPDLCKLRRQAYAAHAATIPVPAALDGWAATMTKRHGPKVQVWANQVPWIVALLVVRYGEAVDHWPAAFTDKDVDRAARWAQGDIPTGVSLVDE